MTRVSWGLVALVFVWPVIMAGLGEMQPRLFAQVPNLVWEIQVAHLLVGGVAIGLGQMLAARIGAALDARAPAAGVATGRS
jgi:hypothetical protein